MLRVTKTENGSVRGFAGTNARITVFKEVTPVSNILIVVRQQHEQQSKKRLLLKHSSLSPAQCPFSL